MKHKKSQAFDEELILEDESKLKNEDSIKPDKVNLKRNYLKWILIIFLIKITLLLFLTALIGFYFFNYIKLFNQTSQTSFFNLTGEFRDGLKSSPVQNNGHVNFIILGLDEVTGRSEGLLTDTIIVASWNLSNSQLNLVSLPRDLWIDAYKTKINALYYYGEINPQSSGKQFVSDVLEEYLQIDIHHTITLNIQTLGELIDILEGVEIDVLHEFEDKMFPRQGVDITTVDDPKVLYETIKFEKGLQTMDGQRALKFIRSRQSTDLEEGTDNARSIRQHQLINAIIRKILDQKTITNPIKLGKIYNWYFNHFGNTSLTVKELVSIARNSEFKKPEIQSINLPISDENNLGLIINPPIEKYQQWVYEPVDYSWEELRTYIKTNLYSSKD